MEVTRKFLLKPCGGEEPQSIITVDGGATLRVDGRVLEMQFECSQGYLVATSDGDPYEEMLHFYLLNGECHVLDAVSLGQIYHPGSLRNVTLSPEDSLEFTFFGVERWRLRILNTARFHPCPRPMASVRYAKGWFHSHYLQLEKCSG